VTGSGPEREALDLARDALRDLSGRPRAEVEGWAREGWVASSVTGPSGVTYSLDVTAGREDDGEDRIEVHVEVSLRDAGDGWSEPLAFAAFVMDGSGAVDGAEAWARSDEADRG
jgi:hypothetical protein